MFPDPTAQPDVLKRRPPFPALRCLRRFSLQSRISAASSGLMMIRVSSMPCCRGTYPRATGSCSLRKLIRILSWFRRPHTLVWRRENSKRLAALFGTGDSHCSTRSRRLSADRTLASGSGGLSGVGWWAYRIASQFQTADRRVTSSPSMSASEGEGSPRLATPSPPRPIPLSRPSQWIRSALSSTNPKAGPKCVPPRLWTIAPGKIRQSLLPA
jgi:hypothetical protein